MKESFKKISRVLVIFLLMIFLPLNVMAQEETTALEKESTVAEITETTKVDSNATEEVGSESGEKASEKKVDENDVVSTSDIGTRASVEVSSEDKNNETTKDVSTEETRDAQELSRSSDVGADDETLAAEEPETTDVEANADNIETNNLADNNDNTETTPVNTAGDSEKSKTDEALENPDEKKDGEVKKDVTSEETGDESIAKDAQSNEDEQTESKKNQSNEDEAAKTNPKEPNEGDENSKNEFEFTIISDTHILPSDMIGDNEDYKLALNSDRKLLTESEGLLREALKKIEEKGSKYIFIPGDLTKDGEVKAHEKLVEILKEWKSAEEGREVFVVPGNHDINNKHAFDFSGTEKTEVETATPGKFMEIYNDFVYENEKVIEKYKDTKLFKDYLAGVNEKLKRTLDYAQGFTSYVARIANAKNEEKNGFTLLGLDTAIYSGESTADGSEYQDTEGRVTLPLIKWIVDKVDEANKRNDVVTVMSHHAFVPHFDKQEHFLSPYIIKEWDTKFEDEDERINGKTPAQILADMGVRFLFTGHLHAQDAAEYVSPTTGNKFYDIQTGSLVTYPLPMRHVKITNNIEDKQEFKLDMETELIDSFTYYDPINGQEVTVEDAMEYASKNQLTPELVAGLVNYYLDHGNFTQFDSKKTILGLLKDNGIEIPEEGYGDKIIEFAKTLLPEPKNIEMMGGMATIDISIKPIENTELYGEGDKIAIDTKILLSKDNLLIRGEKLEQSLDAIFNQIDTKVVTRENIYNYALKLVTKMMEYPIYTNEDNTEVKTLSDIANDAYRAYLKGDEVQPPYVAEVVKKYSDPQADLVKDLLDYAKPEINEIVEDALSKIEYKIEGLEGPGNDTFKFVNNLIEGEKTPNDGRIVKAFLAEMLGANVYKTLQNDTVAGMIPIPKENEKKIQGSDIVNFVYGMEPIQNLLGGLAEKFGSKSITDLAITVVDGMTNEFNGKYPNAFHPDNTHVFNVAVNKKAPGEISLTQGESLAATKTINEEYKVESIKVVVNGEETEVAPEEFDAKLAEIEKTLENGDEVKLVLGLSNQYGNTFSLESELTYAKETTEEPTEPTEPVEPVEPTEPTEPTEPVEPSKPEIVEEPKKELQKEDELVVISTGSSGASDEDLYPVVAIVEKLNTVPTVKLNLDNIKAGEKISLTFENFNLSTKYFIYLEGYGLIGEITTDAFGNAKVEINLPKDLKDKSYKIEIKDENGNVVKAEIVNLGELMAA